MEQNGCGQDKHIPSPTSSEPPGEMQSNQSVVCGKQGQRQGARAVALAILSALLFGLSAPLAKLLVGQIQPFLLAGLLYLGSGIGLSLLWLCRRVKRDTIPIHLSRLEMANLLGAIIFGGVAGPVLLMLALSFTPASSAALLLNLEGVLTALIASLVFKEHIDRRIALGMSAITCGGIFLSIGNGAESLTGWSCAGHIYSISPGCLLIVLACLAWGLDNNLTRNVSHADAVQTTMLKGLVAGLINTTLAFTLPPGLLASAAPNSLIIKGGFEPGGLIEALPVLCGALLVGGLGYGLSLVLFVRALRDLGTARTGAYFACAPFVGAVSSILLLHEPLTWQISIAGLLMLTGVYLHLSEKHDHAHKHDELIHEHEHVHDDHHQHSHTLDDPPGEPHTHVHKHEMLVHSHQHYPDLHHRHQHADCDISRH